VVRFWRMSTVATVAIVDAWHAWTVATPTPGHHRPSKHRSILRRNGGTIVTVFVAAAVGYRSSPDCDDNGTNRIGCSVCRVYPTRAAAQQWTNRNRRNLSAGVALSVVADGDRKTDVVCIGVDCPRLLQSILVGPGIVVSRGIGRSGEEPTRLPGVAFDTVA